MPRNSVVNRRNITAPERKLKPHSLSVSDESVTILRRRAEELCVGQGSLIDTMLREMARTPDQMLLDLMRTHGHLTQEEYGLALDLLAKKKKDKGEPADSAGGPGHGAPDSGAQLP